MLLKLIGVSIFMSALRLMESSAEWDQFCVDVRKMRFDRYGVSRSEYYIPYIYRDILDCGDNWLIVVMYQEDDIHVEINFQHQTYIEYIFAKEYSVTWVIEEPAFAKYFEKTCLMNNVSHCCEAYELMMNLIREANVECYGI